MPELPEVQAHAERLDALLAGREFAGLDIHNVAVIKTPLSDLNSILGMPVACVGRRGKYFLLHVGDLVFAIHLMQAGRLHVDTGPRSRSRGLARLSFSGDTSLVLTEAGRERRAGIWVLGADAFSGPPLDRLGIDALTVTVDQLCALFAAVNMRVHGFLRDQHNVCGLGRMLANEICHRALVSPFAMTSSLGVDGAVAVHTAAQTALAEALAYERGRADMSSTAHRPALVHGRVGLPCLTCGDQIRSVSYSGYSVAYCPVCQTSGRVLADNTTSRFLR